MKSVSGRISAVWVLGCRLSFLTILASEASASSFYVRDSLRDASVRPIEATAATATVRNAVSARLRDEVVRDENLAGYVLQPRLNKINGVYILTVEKIQGQQTLFAAQSRLGSLDDLERAAQVATNTAIDERSLAPAVAGTSPSNQPLARPNNGSAPYHHNGAVAAPASQFVASTSGATTSASESAAPSPQPRGSGAAAQKSNSNDVTSPRAVEIIPTKQTKATQWMVGLGPFISRNLKSDRAMYNLMGGHRWNVNPRTSIHTIVEAAYSSSGDQAQVYNFAVGGNYYIPGDDDTAPFVTVDLGYGMARDAYGNRGDGISLGTGVGFEFFRTTSTNLDLLLRYSMILDDTSPESGVPAVVGLRVGINF